MSLRRAAGLVGLLLLSCAGPQPAPSPAPTPAAGAGAAGPAAAGDGATAASATAEKAPPPPPPPSDAELVATASAAVGAQAVALQQAIAASTDKKLTSARFDEARAALDAIDAALAPAKPVEAKKADYGAWAAARRAEVDKTRAALSALWLEIGLALQRPAVDAALKQANAALATAKQKTANEEAVAKAEAAAAALPGLLARGAPLEAKDAKYAQYAGALKPQLEALSKAAAEARAALALRQKFEALQAQVEPARKAAAEAVAPLAKAPDAAGIEAAEAKIAALSAALDAGKDVLAADKKLGEYGAQVTKEIEARKAAVAQARLGADVASAKAKVDSAEAEMDGRVGVYKTAGGDEAKAAANTATEALAKLLEGSAELAAKDKAFAARVAAAQKKLTAARALLVGLDAEQKITAHKAESAAQKAKVTEALAGLAGKLEYEAYMGAGREIEALDKLLAAGEPLGAVNTKYAGELKAARAEIPGFEMQVRRIWVAATEAEAKKRVEALAKAPDAAAFTEAEKAVKVMSTTVESSKSPTKQDKGYLAFLAAAEKSVAALTAQIQARRAGLAVEQFRGKIEAAATAAADAVKALDGEPAPAAFDAAESAVKTLESETEPDTTQPPAEQAWVAAQRKKVAEHRARIAKRRVEVLVAGHKKDLTPALAELAAKLSALASGVTDAALAEATKAAGALEEIIGRGDEAGKADAKYLAELSVAKAKLTAGRAEIEKRRVEAAVAAHRAKVDAAQAALAEKLAATAGKADAAAFTAAQEAAEALEEALAEGKSITDPKHVALVASLEKKLADQRATLGRGQVSLEIAAHRAEVDAAKAKITEAMGGLAGKVENGPYVAVEKLVAALASTINGGSALAEKDAKYGAELKTRSAEVPLLVMQLRRKRVEACFAVVKERLDGAAAAGEGGLSSAESAIEDAVAAIENARALKTEDKGYAAALAAADKQVEAERARLGKAKTAIAGAAQLEKVRAAEAAVAEKLAGLGKSLEYELYNGADQAVNALEKAIAAGDAIADPAAAKELAASRGKLDGHRSAVRAKWIEAARAAAEERLGALAGKPDEKAFKAADDAVTVLARTVEGGKSVSKAPAYVAMLAAADKGVAASRARIEKRRAELVVEAHAAELDAAEKSLAEKLAALGPAAEETSFKAAEKAVDELAGVVDAGGEAGGKDAKYAARLAGVKGKLAGYRTSIAQKQVDAVVASHRSKLEAARGAVKSALDGLAKAESVDEADKSINELESVIGGGKSAGEKSAKYAGELAAETKRLGEYRTRVSKRRVELEVTSHGEEVAEARGAAEAALAAMGQKPEKGTFEAAESALGAWESKLKEREEFAKTSPGYAQKLAAQEGEVAKKRAQIAKSRAALSVAAHRKSVEEASELVAEKLGGLGKSLEYELYNAADQAVTKLEKVVSSGEELGELDAAYGKELQGWAGKIEGHRIMVRAKWVEAAQLSVSEKLEVLSGKVEEKSFKAAEDAVTVYEKTVVAGKELTKSANYQKQYAGWDKQVGVFRGRIEKRRAELVVEEHAAELDAAEKSLAEKLAALGPAAEETSFKAAEKAVDELAGVLEDGGEAAGKDAKYAARLAGVKGKLAGYRTSIAQKQVDAVVASHRSKLEAARGAVKSALDGLAKAESVDEADKSINELESVIGGGKSAGEKSAKYAGELAAETKRLGEYRTRVSKRRVELEVTSHGEEVAEARGAAEAALAAMGQKPEKGTFEAAESALGAWESKLKEREEFAKTSPGYAQKLAAQEGEVAKKRAQIAKSRAALSVAAHRKSVEEASELVAEKLGGLGKSLEYELYNAADQAVTKLEKVVSSGEELGELDAAYGKELQGWAGKIEGHRIMVRAKWVEAAQLSVSEKLEVLSGKVEEKSFKAAEDAVTVYEKTVVAGKELTKSANYQKQYAGWDKQVGVFRGRIEKRRAELVVEEHAVKLDAAEKSLAEKLAALGPAAEDDAFKTADKAVDELSGVLDDAGEAAGKDAQYAKRVAALRAKLAGYRTGIAQKRVDAVVQAHKAKLDAARADVKAKMDAVAKAADEAPLAPAETAIGELESVVDGGKAAGEKSAKYAAELAAEKKKAGELRARIAKRKTDLAVAAQVKEIEEAQGALTEAVKALGAGAEAAAFTAAEEAVGEVEEAVEGAAELGKGSPALAKRVAAAKADVPKKRAAIASAKVAQEAAAQKKALEAAAQEADARVEGLEGDASPGAVKAAEGAVASLESAMGAGKELAQKSPAHAKALAAYGKKAADLRRAIARRAVEKEVEANKAAVAEANAAVAEQLGKLGKSLEYELYNAASQAVAALDKALAEGESLEDRDPAYGKVVKAARARVEGQYIAIRTKWIEAANAAVVEKLAGKGDEEAALEAVSVLERTIESGQEVSRAPAYQKTLAGWARQAEGHRARIAKAKLAQAVSAHLVEVQEAEGKASEAIASLLKSPDDAAVKAANSAVEELVGTLDSTTEAVAKEPGHAKRIGAVKAKVKGMRASIERGRFDADVRAVRDRIVSAIAGAEAKLAALGAAAEAPQFSAAEDAISDVESALDDGKGFAKDNKTYAKELAGQQKKVPALRARVARLKTEIEVTAATKALDEAAEAADSAMETIEKSGSSEAFETAAEAVDDLGEQVDESAKLAKGSPALARRLAVLKKDVPKKRAIIAKAKVASEVAAHKKSLEEARAEAEQRIEQLANGVTPSSVKAAENAISSLASTVESGKAVAKKSAPYGKVLAGYPRVVAQLKLDMKRREVEVDLKAHRQEVAEAEGTVKERVAGLGKSLEYELYNGAEQAVNALDKVIEEGAPLGERDDRYAKELKVARGRIEAYRIAVRQAWIDAAREAAEEKMGALGANADDRALEAASSAVTVLQRTIESGKDVSKAKGYQRNLAVASKQAATFAKTIDKKRAAAEFGEVRGQLDEAVTEASAQVKAAEKDPEAVEGAKKALDELAEAIDDNEAAAAKDPAHKKRLAVLRKKLAADRAKITRLGSAADTKKELAAVIDAEETLASALATLKKRPDEAAVDAAEEAAGALESVIASRADTADPKAKKRYAADKKKIALARAAINKVRGEAGVGEHKAQVETQLASAREAMAALKKGGDRESIATAKSSVEALLDAVAAGRDVAKQNKKYGVYLAGVKKTALKYQATVSKMHAVTESPAASDEPEADEGEDPVAKVASAQTTLKQTLAALIKNANEDTLSSAKVALADLSDTVESSKPAAKKNKALAKKLALAKAQVAKSKPIVARMEAKVAKAAAKAAAASGAPEGDADEGEDPRKALASAWASFTRQTKAFKGKKVTLDQVDAALSAADDVDGALEAGARSPQASSPKYKKLAASIKKRLKVERAKLTKKKKALEKAGG